MAAASVVSESFVPNIHSSLTIEAFFRASEPATKVRVWIEGVSGGKPYVRRTEMTVSTEWEGRAVRASDVPAGGLESARLRFELLAPGSLWIDDLHVPGEITSKSGLLNARRTLLAAIQAYREERYAEFARLAGSHWIQESSAAATTRLARLPGSPSRPGAGSARATAPYLLPFRRTVSSGKVSKRRIEMFVACNTLCFAREPMEAALRQIVELEFDKFELSLLEHGQHLRLSEAGDDPEGALAKLREGPSLVPSSLYLDFGPVDWFDPLTPPALRRPLPAGQIAQRRRHHDARRATRHARLPTRSSGSPH